MKNNKLLSFLVLATFSGLAAAHGGADHEHGLAAGFTHPFTGLDHLAAMLAVGIWSAGTAQRRWLAPLVFVVMVLAGALLLGSVPAEAMIAVSLVAIGALLLSPKQMPITAGAVLMGGFALFHGAAHGQELGGAAALAGMVIGTAVLHGLGIALGLVLRKQSLWLPRIAGAGIALFGLGLLA